MAIFADNIVENDRVFVCSGHFWRRTNVVVVWVIVGWSSHFVGFIKPFRGFDFLTGLEQLRSGGSVHLLSARSLLIHARVD
jgi:hypothetical protein